MTIEERRKVIQSCEKGMIGIVEFLRMQNGGYTKRIDAEQMIKGIKWFCGDNAEDLENYLKK